MRVADLLGSVGGIQIFMLIQAVIAWILVIGWARPFFIQARQEVHRKEMSIDTILALGFGLGLLWSTYALFFREPSYFLVIILGVGVIMFDQWFEARPTKFVKKTDVMTPTKQTGGRLMRMFPLGLVLIASLTLIIGGFVFTSPAEAFRRAMTVFLIASSCALGRNPASPFVPARGWTFLYASMGAFLAAFGFASPPVVLFFLLCSSLTVFVSTFMVRRTRM
jgi:cation transport ATPase